MNAFGRCAPMWSPNASAKATRLVVGITALEELAGHLGVSRDDLDARDRLRPLRRGLVVEETAGSCHGCALAGSGCVSQGPRPVRVTVRSARSE
jgi:hypothetical protein